MNDKDVSHKKTVKKKKTSILQKVLVILGKKLFTALFTVIPLGFTMMVLLTKGAKKLFQT